MHHVRTMSRLITDRTRLERLLMQYESGAVEHLPEAERVFMITSLKQRLDAVDRGISAGSGSLPMHVK